ncbi:MAG: DHH family phosphoesterase [Euryarchaeota archaeon]|nr:DHH family phosphoesterase [Euryarchaeota archaeon]MDE1836783.1 DHH family phosphoesterase [Euryarchaeota archaeon]MDE1879801.1 DHH family phosphoesterase [Euryarchaeota archaeon]MDE2044767.1 DHH family phosphoesterase [Thermoplasmata archaeon]
MSGPSLEGLVADPNASRELRAAADLFASSPGRWRVLYHNDGDGIASASVAALTLSRLGRSWQLSPLLGVEQAGVDRVLRATRGPLLVVDTGSSFLDLFAAHDRPVIVLDHHVPPGVTPTARSLAFVNPHHWGVDGMTELSASMLTYLFARELLPGAFDLLAFGLSGAIADRMHVGGFQGLNRKLIEEAQARGALTRRSSLNLVGPSLEEALASSLDPYFVGISGRIASARTLLSSLGLPPTAPVGSLGEEEGRRLASALLSQLLTQGARPEFCERLREERIVLPHGGWEANELSRWQNACGREGEPSLGIALALGDPGAHQRARELEARWRGEVLEGLERLEKKGALHREPHLQWFEAPKPDLAGTIAGLALAYFADPLRPIVALAPKGEAVKVSSRGTLWLTGQGLNLDRACREAAAAVGGEGGGHAVASGATIPRGREADFLREAGRIVEGQIGGLHAPPSAESTAVPSSG